MRLLCAAADPATEADWIARAREVSVATLAEMVSSARAARGMTDHDETVHDEDDGLIDGEPPLRLRIPCPARVRALWRCALELARRVAGEELVPLPVCMGHHLQGIHTNVIRAWGAAPHDVHWELGIRADAPPFASFVGDRVCRPRVGDG